MGVHARWLRVKSFLEIILGHKAKGFSRALGLEMLKGILKTLKGFDLEGPYSFNFTI